MKNTVTQESRALKELKHISELQTLHFNNSDQERSNVFKLAFSSWLNYDCSSQQQEQSSLLPFIKPSKVKSEPEYAKATRTKSRTLNYDNLNRSKNISQQLQNITEVPHIMEQTVEKEPKFEVQKINKSQNTQSINYLQIIEKHRIVKQQPSNQTQCNKTFTSFDTLINQHLKTQKQKLRRSTSRENQLELQEYKNKTVILGMDANLFFRNMNTKKAFSSKQQDQKDQRILQSYDTFNEKNFKDEIKSKFRPQKLYNKENNLRYKVKGSNFLLNNINPFHFQAI